MIQLNNLIFLKDSYAKLLEMVTAELQKSKIKNKQIGNTMVNRLSEQQAADQNVSAFQEL